MTNLECIVYQTFSLVIGAIGTGAGVFLLTRLRKNTKDRVLFAIILMMAACDLWFGGVYLFVGIGTIKPSSVISIGAFVRPAMPLALLLPAILVQKLGI
jgi:hypothetical protein